MKLLPLICADCQEPLKPDNDDIITVCPRCHQIYQFSDQALQPIAVQFMSSGQTQAREWTPFWVFQGQVKLTQRETQGGGSKSAQSAEQLWQTPRRFYVPAWELPMNRVQEIGGQMIQQQPDLQSVSRPDHFTLRPAIVTADDARKMVEFIILAIEARREDYLKSLAFQLQLGEAQLWALPG